MANTSAHKINSCSLMLLVLIFNFFSTSHGSSILQSVCDRTKNPSLCLTALGSDSRSRKAGLAALAQIAIDTAESEAVHSKVKIHGLLLAAKEPKLIDLYTNCEDWYMDALDALTLAPHFLTKRRYGYLEAQGVLVSDRVGRCEASFKIVRSPITKGARDVQILGEAIAVMAKDLSRRDM